MAARQSGLSERDRLSDLRSQREAWRHKARVGGAFLGAGVLITVVTYAIAASSSGGGTYFVFFGPVIFGSIRLVDASRHLRRIDAEIAALHRGSPAPWGAVVPPQATAGATPAATWGTPAISSTPPPVPPPPAP
jgi:hypothetical protein